MRRVNEDLALMQHLTVRTVTLNHSLYWNHELRTIWMVRADNILRIQSGGHSHTIATSEGQLSFLFMAL
jgi:hypothetical protein